MLDDLVMYELVCRGREGQPFIKLAFHAVHLPRKATHWKAICLEDSVTKGSLTDIPKYLFGLIPETNHIYNTCSSENITILYSRTDVCIQVFFLSIYSQNGTNLIKICSYLKSQSFNPVFLSCVIQKLIEFHQYLYSE